MGWLDDASKWLEDREKEAENLTDAVAKAPTAAVQALITPITNIQKKRNDAVKEIEETILKYGNMPYDMLPETIKTTLTTAQDVGEDIGKGVTDIISELGIPELPKLPSPTDLFSTAKEILSILRDVGGIATNWRSYTTKIFTELKDYFEELEKYGGRRT